MFAAYAVWILLNGKHLPRAMASRGRNNVLVNVMLLVFGGQ